MSENAPDVDPFLEDMTPRLSNGSATRPSSSAFEQQFLAWDGPDTLFEGYLPNNFEKKSNVTFTQQGIIEFIEL